VKTSNLLGVDGHHDALRTITPGGVRDQLRIQHGGGVDADLVGTGIQQIAHIADFAHPAADSQRNEHLRGDLFDDAENNPPVVRAGGDVEKSQFVRALLVIAARNFHRVAGIAQLDKTHAFDHAPRRDIKTGNNSFGEHPGLTVKG